MRILSVILCLFSIGVLAPAYAEVDNTPIVIVRMDDCQPSWATPFAGLGGKSGLQYGMEKKIPITWAVISSRQAPGAWSFTWDQLKAYLDTAGGEAASHSVNHMAMSSTSDYVNEVINSKPAIEAKLPGYKVTTFLQPGTWTGDAYLDTWAKYDGDIGQAIKSTYAQSQAYLGIAWRVGNNYYSHGVTAAIPLDYGPSVTPDFVKYILNVTANTPGAVMEFTGHGVQEAGNTLNGAVQADVLAALMDEASRLASEHKIRLMGIDAASHALFSEDLNHVYDPGFDLYDARFGTYGPWKCIGNSSVVSTDGHNSPRYGMIPDGSSRIEAANMMLPPGRYELSWWQKTNSTTTTLPPLVVTMYEYSNSYRTYQFGILNSSYKNSTPGVWERKSAFLLAQDKYLVSALIFRPDSACTIGLDDISMVKAPVDPAVSPSGATATPSLGQYKLTWQTPNDPNVTNICIRYGTSCHPTTPNEGSNITTMPAVQGSTQEYSAATTWNTAPAEMYFSIFGIKSDGSYTPPDLAAIYVDKSAPALTSLNAVSGAPGMATAVWSFYEPESQIIQYQYAVGRSAGAADVVSWTNTGATQIILSNLPNGVPLYFSVKARNTFGFWSSTATSSSITIYGGLDPSGETTWPIEYKDTTPITITGTITAVFADSCYIEKSDRTRGIRLTGNIASYTEGQQVTVTGTLGTDLVTGERVLVIP